MIKGLNELDIYTRPIHSISDKSLYVKENDIWETDDISSKYIIKNAITDVEKKRFTLIKQIGENKTTNDENFMQLVKENVDNINNNEIIESLVDNLKININ